MQFQWDAGIVLVVSIVGVNVIGKWLLFQVSDIYRMREYNSKQDVIKQRSEKYRSVLSANDRIGLISYLVFFVGIVPFFITLNAQPLWKVLFDIILIIFLYDFFYYVVHRFLFHGIGFFRRVHALHHRARMPTYIDARYVHPLELIIGIALFMATVTMIGALTGPLHAITVSVSFLIFLHINLLNHTHIDLPFFPYKTLTWISKKHAIHHKDMHRGNFATITLLYDKLFRTYE